MASRRDESRARTRAALIEAGVSLMHAQGYDATSTTQIARAAGVSPATLFNYFPTKASIVFADDPLWSAPDVVPAGETPAATLSALVEAWMTNPAWTRPADDPLTAQRFELVRRELTLQRAQNEQLVALIPAVAERLVAAHPTLESAEALAVVGAVVGAVIAVLSFGPQERVDHVVAAAVSVALTGARPRQVDSLSHDDKGLR